MAVAVATGRCSSVTVLMEGAVSAFATGALSAGLVRSIAGDSHKDGRNRVAKLHLRIGAALCPDSIDDLSGVILTTDRLVPGFHGIDSIPKADYPRAVIASSFQAASAHARGGTSAAPSYRL